MEMNSVEIFIKKYDVIVVGGGLVGLVVVIYLVCKGLNVVVIVEWIGG